MTRTDLLNYLIQKHNLKSYCELGTQNRAQNFDKIQCADKFCVDIDPNAKADFIGSTDDFFKSLNRKFDLYFVDASHIAEDVERDFVNCLKHGTEKVFIVLHDCNPEYEQYTVVPREKPSGHWHGDVYKFASKLERKVTVDTDCGCLIATADTWITDRQVDWKTFYRDRVKLLNLISVEQFKSINSHV